MGRKEIIQVLTEKFIQRFGEGTEVCLLEDIIISRDTELGCAYMTKLRYINGHLEYYYDFWNSEWKSDKSTLNKFAIKALSQVLGVKIKTIVNYEYELMSNI